MLVGWMLRFDRIDPDRDRELCERHKRDACQLSFGHQKGFQGGDNYGSWLRDKCEEFPDGFVLAWAGQECVGQIEMQVPFGLSRGYVWLFYVTPPFRGRGYGRLLHDYVERYFRAWEANRIELHVSPTNARALGFYRHLGYEDLGLETEGRTDPSLKMAKTLAWQPSGG